MTAAPKLLNALPFILLAGASILTCLTGPIAISLLVSGERQIELPIRRSTNDALHVLAVRGQQENACFGSSVAISGNNALIGCPLRNGNYRADGAAYLFRRDEFGTWSKSAILCAKPGSREELFGYSVALNSHCAVLSVCPANRPQLASQPTAYIYQCKGRNRWKLTASLLFNDAVDRDVHHVSVALDENTVLLGQISHELSASGICESAYLFREVDQGRWQQIAKLENPNPLGSNKFGVAVALDGRRAVVGASTEDSTTSETGAVYLYREDRLGNWKSTARLAANDETCQLFGISVAICGRLILVGAPGSSDPNSNCFKTGAAYLYRENDDGAGWRLVAKLTADDATDWDCFGMTVALSNGFAAVGAPGCNDGAGAAYLYRLGSSGEIDSVTKLTHPAAEPRDGFARSIALSDDTILAGVPYQGIASQHSGAAYWAPLPKLPDMVPHFQQANHKTSY